MEERIRIMLPLLDERQRRIFLAAEAKTYGRGGISTVSRLSGVAPYTIRQGLKEIDSGEPIERKEKMRLQGAGRKKLQDNIPDIERHIQEIVDGSTPVFAVGHDCQVVDVEVEVREFDTAIDYIVTPTRVIRTRSEFPKPTGGILWSQLAPGMREQIPPIQELWCKFHCK